jgi:hypothetical protein
VCTAGLSGDTATADGGRVIWSEPTGEAMYIYQLNRASGLVLDTIPETGPGRELRYLSSLSIQQDASRSGRTGTLPL